MSRKNQWAEQAKVLPSMDGDYEKVTRTISSCTTQEQLESANRMIDAFRTKWRENPWVYALTNRLKEFVQLLSEDLTPVEG